MSEVWIGPTYGHDDDAPPMVQAFRFISALLRMCGWRDQTWDEAETIVEDIRTGRRGPGMTADEAIAALRAGVSTNTHTAQDGEE